MHDLPRFEVRPLDEAEGGGYLIEFPEFPGCMADGETPGEAMREGADALKSYLETLRQLWTARSLRGSGFRGAVAAACSPVAACRAGAPRRPRRGVPQHAGDDPAGRRPRTPDLRPPFWRSA